MPTTVLELGIDTREQKPFKFPSQLMMNGGGLVKFAAVKERLGINEDGPPRSVDYALRRKGSIRWEVIAERKGDARELGNNLYGPDRTRFISELDIMASYPVPIVALEFPYSTLGGWISGSVDGYDAYHELVKLCTKRRINVTWLPKRPAAAPCLLRIMYAGYCSLTEG